MGLEARSEAQGSASQCLRRRSLRQSRGASAWQVSVLEFDGSSGDNGDNRVDMTLGRTRSLMLLPHYDVVCGGLGMDVHRG